MINFALTLIIGSLIWTSGDVFGLSVQKLETWNLRENSSAPDFSVSIYVFQNSSWKKQEIKDRILKMNEALSHCGSPVTEVRYFSIDSEFTKVRVDDLDAKDYEDGMKRIAREIEKETVINFFYFEDYVEPFSSMGSYPLAVYKGSKNTHSFLNDTAWFPYKSGTRRDQVVLPYSEEAHELGHLLLRRGHDDTKEPNIMHFSGSMRSAHFSSQQCGQFQLPNFKKMKSCETLKERFMPNFSTHYQTYRNTHYMSLYCVRNVENLNRHLVEENLIMPETAQIVYLLHKDETSSVRPKAARYGAASWSFHSFLVFDGLVLDQDFKRSPTLSNLSDYLEEMWGSEIHNFRFQIRNVSEIGEYTNYDLRESFKNKKFLEVDAQGLKAHFKNDTCF